MDSATFGDHTSTKRKRVCGLRPDALAGAVVLVFLQLDAESGAVQLVLTIPRSQLIFLSAHFRSPLSLSRHTPCQARARQSASS